jgi:hypothetical protein
MSKPEFKTVSIRMEDYEYIEKLTKKHDKSLRATMSMIVNDHKKVTKKDK